MLQYKPTSLAAISHRPLVDFPDQIKFPATPVRIGAEKTLLVKNIGHVPASFNILTRHPFYILPLKGIIQPDERMQFTLSFKPNCVAMFTSEILIRYESGEKLTIDVCGTATKADVQLEKHSIRFSDTYMALSHQRTLKLFNNSDYIIKFKWKQYPSYTDDKNKSQDILDKCKFMKEHQSCRDNKLETYEVITHEGHVSVCERILSDEIEEFESSNQFLFKHPHFQILPLVSYIKFKIINKIIIFLLSIVNWWICSKQIFSYVTLFINESANLID